LKFQATREACFVCGSTMSSWEKTRPPFRLTSLSARFSTGLHCQGQRRESESPNRSWKFIAPRTQRALASQTRTFEYPLSAAGRIEVLERELESLPLRVDDLRGKASAKYTPCHGREDAIIRDRCKVLPRQSRVSESVRSNVSGPLWRWAASPMISSKCRILKVHSIDFGAATAAFLAARQGWSRPSSELSLGSGLAAPMRA
jgi:hypothetical protein